MERSEEYFLSQMFCKSRFILLESKRLVDTTGLWEHQVMTLLNHSGWKFLENKLPFWKRQDKLLKYVDLLY